MRYLSILKPTTLVIATVSASFTFYGNAYANVERPFCPPGTTPYPGGMCDIGSLATGELSVSGAYAISEDGSTIVGQAGNDEGEAHAFRWTSDGRGMLDLGTLKADNSGSSVAQHASADGSTIVGSSDTDDGISRAFRWIDDGTGMLDLGTLRTDNTGYSHATAISSDGSTIVGSADSDWGMDYRAFRWIDDGNGMLDLGTLKADNSGQSYATAVSADGSTIVGYAQDDGGLYNLRAFRWVDDGTGLLDLGTLKADNSGQSFAETVSADGSVIVGYSDTDDGNRRAFRWMDDGADMLDLGSLRADNLGYSAATAVSADGGVIVGSAEVDSGLSRAFRWVDDGTGMLDLGSLRADNLGTSDAAAVSADGGTIVGTAENDSGANRAFRWIDDGKGMLDLGTLKADNSGSSTATGVSADGSIIVGNSYTDDGLFRAFIWRTKMQDFDNLLISFPALTNDSEVAVAQQQSVADQLMRASCLAEEGQKCLSIDGVVTNAGATSDDIGSRNSGGGQVTLGYGLDGKTTVGGTLNISATNLNNSGFDLGTNTAASVWAEYSESGLVGTGMQAEAALGKGRASGKIARGRDLDNVMLATGNASLETVFAHVSLGYGFQIKDWLVTPNGTLAHYRTSRSAYSETGSDFNANYDKLSMKRTTATLEVIGERHISRQGTLLLGAGIERDLDADRAVLSGTSDLPGVETFDMGSVMKRHETRGFATLGYAHDLGGNQTLSGSLRTGQSAFGNSAETSIGISYGVRF